MIILIRIAQHVLWKTDNAGGTPVDHLNHPSSTAAGPGAAALQQEVTGVLAHAVAPSLTAQHAEQPNNCWTSGLRAGTPRASQACQPVTKPTNPLLGPAGTSRPGPLSWAWAWASGLPGATVKSVRQSCLPTNRTSPSFCLSSLSHMIPTHPPAKTTPASLAGQLTSNRDLFSSLNTARQAASHMLWPSQSPYLCLSSPLSFRPTDFHFSSPRPILSTNSPTQQ
ncbi:hypothetical protein BD289DRAFT_159214 [Coniella lustricola]|uniref:Uncharacterized protein n=1 Tax=Coniella lustricola TaxID=2025994 RepID=A0A2T3AEK1_9PEZI|nr:hypothetical protein BD289DRAFT_159214 [Coniella lustricola]